MESRTVGALGIHESTDVAEARRFVAGLGRSLGLDETQVAKAALVVTEAAANVIKHADSGELVVNVAHERNTAALLLLVLDKGPGIANVPEALRDGYSTAGSPGTGMGAITRNADELDIYSVPGSGAVLFIRLGPRSPDRAGGVRAIRIGGISVPKAGEDVSGDAWSCGRDRARTRILVVDGLGHGIDAAEAARVAVHTFDSDSSLTPADAMQSIHMALRPTRGAVGAIAEIDTDSQTVRYTGVGNISAAIVGGERERNLISHAGTLGQGSPRFQHFEYPWDDKVALVMHSDGLSRKWDVNDYPGLITRRPLIIAGALYRDFRRERDDAAVVVAKQGRAST